jgi:hypothetical protein
MGIGATQADIDKMVANTSDQCAFACHDTNNNKNYYKLAKTLGVTMRIDRVRTATQMLMATAQATATVTNQYRVATYTFGDSAASPGLTTITALTSNLSQAATDAAAIDLMTVAGQNQNSDQDTDRDAAKVPVLRIRRRGRRVEQLVPEAVGRQLALPGTAQ